ncbi:MAG TPA: hypothetical protein VFO55_08895 [Gemmatimonadaceae bacterium]|nr:hypothetical protein [Gemmatimonadaceae bacterium]
MSTALEAEGRSRLTAVGIAQPSGAPSASDSALTRTEWALRIGASACFIGHGAFGVLTKEAWLPFFALVGIGRDLAYALMPVVGTVDIAAGVLVLVSPRPIVLAYMVVWGLWTALLRPLAGDSFFQALERAGNYGVPLALGFLFGVGRSRGWFAPYVDRSSLIDRVLIGRVLLWTTATLLFAHGALQAITREPSFGVLYGAVGAAPEVVPMIGWLEMALAVAVVLVPTPALLIAVAVWKLATEALFPMSGAPIWEFVERGGSYAAPFALVLLHGRSPFTRINLSRSDR